MLVTPIACLMFNRMEWLSKLQIQGFVKKNHNWTAWKITTKLYEKITTKLWTFTKALHKTIIINFYQTNWYRCSYLWTTMVPWNIEQKVHRNDTFLEFCREASTTAYCTAGFFLPKITFHIVCALKGCFLLQITPKSLGRFSDECTG